MNENATLILKGLMNIPKGTEILLASTPYAWVFCVVLAPTHCYYIVVDRRAGNEN